MEPQPQRSATLTVFGIINILWGALGLVGLAIALPLQAIGSTANQPQLADLLPGWAVTVSNGLGAAVTLALLAGGIGMLNAREWGRKLTLGYAIYQWIAVPAWMAMVVVLRDRLLDPTVYAPEQAAHMPDPQVFMLIMAVSMAFGAATSLIYPTVLLVVFTRPRVVAQFDDGIVADRPVGERAPDVSGSDEWLTSLVPIQNGYALSAALLGLVALIPGVGLFMALAVVPLAITGLRAWRIDPSIKGRPHCWVGLVLAALSLAGHVALVVTIAGSMR